MVSRRTLAIECLVFLLVLIATMGIAPLGVRPEQINFKSIAAIMVLRDAALMALVMYLVWRNGENFSALGWIRKHARREVAVGVVLFIPFIITLGLLEGVLRAFGLPAPAGPPAYLLPRSTLDHVIAVVLLLIVAVSEETIFRGYLMRRFEQVSASRHFAVMLSAFLFALGHAYQGPLGAIAVGIVGVVFALIYLWRGSLIAPMTIHFIQNFMGLLVAPKFVDRTVVSFFF